MRAIVEFLSSLPKDLVTLILAILPISELRGAIPYGMAAGLNLGKVLVIAVIGNLIPVIPILFLLEPVSEYLRRFWPFKKFFDWLYSRTRRKAALIEKYEALGLMLFVAVPLPATGAWTGCVAASLFKIRLRYAFLAITAGVLLAALIVTIFCLLGKGICNGLIVPHN